MSDVGMHDFGLITEHSDSFEFHIDTSAGGCCLLVAVVQTERGPRRTHLAEIPAAVWRNISARVVRELAQHLEVSERNGKKAPNLKTGANRLGPLVGRELALLLWALQEEGAFAQLEAILHGWRELAREERWWLYAKAGAPGQKSGAGWRRALFHALSEAAETRSATPPAEKKSPAKVVCSHCSAQPRLKEPTQITVPTEKNPNRPAARKRKTTITANLNN